MNDIVNKPKPSPGVRVQPVVSVPHECMFHTYYWTTSRGKIVVDWRECSHCRIRYRKFYPDGKWHLAPIQPARYMDPETYDNPLVNQANREHDRRYGWSIAHPNIYRKPDETCTVITRADKNDPEALWPEILAYEAAKRLRVMVGKDPI